MKPDESDFSTWNFLATETDVFHPSFVKRDLIIIIIIIISMSMSFHEPWEMTHGKLWNRPVSVETVINFTILPAT